MKKFDNSTADQYDQEIRLKVPGYELMQELICAILKTELGHQPHLLVAGSGTGEEIIRLSQLGPHWKFDAVEPSPDMIGAAKKRIMISKTANEIRFFKSSMESFNQAIIYDGALSLLVSHFIPDDGRKEKYFAAIAGRLTPNALLLTVDLMEAESLHQKNHQCLYNWAKERGLPFNQLEQLTPRMNSLFFPVTESRLEEIFLKVGLKIEGRFFQGLNFVGYLARKLTNF